MVNAIILRTAGAELLAEFRFGFMAVTTATAFALLSGALLLHLLYAGTRWAETTVWVVSVLVAAAGLHAFIGRSSGFTTWWEVWLDSGIPVKVPYQMRPAASLLLIFSAFNLWALTRRETRLPWVKETALISAGILLLLGFLSVLSSTAGNPMFGRTEPLNVSMLTALDLGLFNGALLLSVSHVGRLRRMLFGVYEAADLPPLLRNDRAAFGLLALALALVLGGLVAFLRFQTAGHRRQVAAELQLTADLRARQLGQWHQERLKDVRALAGTPHLTAMMGNLMSGAATPQEREEWRRWLASYARIYGYRGVVLVDATMTPLLAGSVRESLPVSFLHPHLRDVPRTTDILEMPPYVDETNVLRLDFAGIVRREPGAAPLGAVVVQSEPSGIIQPLLQAWPFGNQTGQFSLWRRDGSRLVSLGGYRMAKGLDDEDLRPFGQVRDLDQPGLLLARAAAGETGLLEGRDVRGIDVIGIGRLIPDTHWLLAGRVDANEIYAPLRRSAWQVTGLTVVMFSLFGFFLTRLARERMKDLQRERIVAELAQKRTAARLGAVLRHANDMIFLLDPNHRIIEANQRAVETYGWTETEFRSMHAQQLRSPAARVNFERDVASEDRQRGAIFETEHQRKDGSVFPVELSVRRIEVDGRQQSLAIIRDITDRKRTEAELRESEERYRLIAENTSDVIWLYDLAADGFSYVSAAARTVLGYEPAEMLGVNLTLTLPGELAMRIREVSRQLREGVQADGRSRHTVVEVDQRHKDGRFIPTEVTASVLPGPDGQPRHVLGITRDITERRRAHEALVRFSEELEGRVVARTAELETRNREIQALLDSIPDTVLLCDSAGAIVFSHLPPPDIRPAPVARAFVPDDGRVHDPAMRDLVARMITTAQAERGTSRQDFDFTGERGETVTLEARATAIGSSRVLLLCADITARKELERAMLANLEREKQLSEMKSQFVSVASHEFRTPLAAAIGSLDLLDKHLPRLTDEKRRELIGRSRQSLNRLTAIISSVLNLSRADSGRITVKRMSTDLDRFIQDIIQEIELADGLKHPLIYRKSGEQFSVPVDTNLLHHIVTNLLGNATRYSAAGSPIAVTLEAGAGEFAITVADEGIGIPPGDRARIFEPFARGSNVGQIGGTGLGLNIVKRYTELMGGRIELLDTAKGTAFRVTVPLGPANP